MEREPTIAELDARLARIEKDMKRLFEHLGLEPDDGTGGVPSEVIELVREGKRLQAIKRYSELAGVDMTTAQRVILGITP
jgi:hypothetical protein